MSDDKTAILQDCQTAVADLTKALTSIPEAVERLKGALIRGQLIFAGENHEKILTALKDCESSVHLLEVNELFTLRRAIEQG